MAKPYPPDVRERALQTALERLHEFPSPYAAAVALGPTFGVKSESLRQWIVAAQRRSSDTAPRSKIDVTDDARLHDLRRENRRLRAELDALKLTVAIFARDLPKHPDRMTLP
ncbi:transposase [Rhodococcus aetherivorans]|uniref:transposase n=1 Tax=Rhodococcus aetherivorans TaxID=191292 RepID=UPI003670228C